MRRLNFPIVAMFLTVIGLAGAFALVQIPAADAQEPTPDAVPGEIIIAFNSGVGKGAIQTFNRQNGLSEKEDLTGIAGGRRGRTILATFNGDVNQGLLTRLSRNPNVRYAEPNYLVSIDASPDDPSYGSLWGLNNTGQTGGTTDADIGVEGAWTQTTGSSSIIVGSIDTGINYLHEDLAANIWTNPGETGKDANGEDKADNGYDDDGNGYIDDVHGINAITNTGDPMDDHFHGSHTAGTIGAVGDNGIGVVGVNWNISIIGCKFLDANGGGNIADAVQCFKYFNYMKNRKGQDIRVTNNSWGGGGYSQALRDAMEGLDQPGMSPILHATAAGNSTTNIDVSPFYPASFTLDNNIVVAATDHNDLYASFSSYGATSVDLAAPGVNILSTVLGDGYDSYSGTSMATPHVAGAAALISEQYPNLTAVQMKQVLLSNVDDVSGLGANASRPTITGGRLNVLNVLTALNADITPPGAVENLADSNAGLRSISVNWTAVGNDGSTGQASSYDVRYATFPINEDNWASASQAVGEPDPQSAGSAENFTITGLDHSTTYYIRLKVFDQVFNESGLSNEAQASTEAATTVFQDDMESGSESWTAAGSPGLWHISQRRATSPAKAWYYGMEFLGNYDTFSANYGTLTSQAIDLTQAPEAELFFKEWSEVENLAGWDRTRVQISTDASVWTTIFESHGTSGVWEDRTVDLTPYVGGYVYLRFYFDTVDNLYNNFEGWYVDDVLVLARGSNSPPVADPGGLYNGTEDLPVAFDGSASLDPDGKALTYIWNFGDGNTGAGVNPSHIYIAGGDYTVTLVVNDGTYDSPPETTTAEITDVNDPPVADPGGPPPGGPYTGTEGVAVDFNGSASSDPEGDSLTYAWNFGD
ncbi:MAG: S8 family serine peptidase, partial [Dehalococcoidia bacterium]